MAEKYQIYASGEQSNRVTVWHNYIYASHLKNRTWIITFVSDGEDGRFSMSARNIRQPTEFVDALYAEDGLVKVLHVEESPGVCEASGGESLLAAI